MWTPEKPHLGQHWAQKTEARLRSRQELLHADKYHRCPAPRRQLFLLPRRLRHTSPRCPLPVAAVASCLRQAALWLTMVVTKSFVGKDLKFVAYTLPTVSSDVLHPLRRQCTLHQVSKANPWKTLRHRQRWSRNYLWSQTQVSPGFMCFHVIYLYTHTCYTKAKILHVVCGFLFSLTIEYEYFRKPFTPPTSDQPAVHSHSLENSSILPVIWNATIFMN